MNGAQSSQEKPIQKVQSNLNLQKELQAFKKRIDEVESKNQKVIDRIHQAYNFQNKPFSNQQLPNQRPTRTIIPVTSQIYRQRSPQINTENNTRQTQFNQNLFKRKGSASDKAKQQQQNRNSPNRKSIDCFQIKNRKSLNYEVKNHQAQENLISNRIRISTDNFIHEIKAIQCYKQIEPSRQKAAARHPPYQPNRYNSLRMQPSSQRSAYQEVLKVETISYQAIRNKQLEGELYFKEEQIHRLKTVESKVNTFRLTVKLILESSLQNFMVDNVQSFALTIKTKIKKVDCKIKNLLMNVNDYVGQHKKNKLFQKRREKPKRQSERSLSIKDKHAFEGLLSLNKREKAQSFISLPANFAVNHHSQIVKQVWFEQVANKYEAMIKLKEEQKQSLQRLNKKLNTEIRELHQTIDMNIKTETKTPRKSLSDSRDKYELQIAQKRIRQLETLIYEVQSSKKASQSQYIQNISKSKTTTNELARVIQDKCNTLQLQLSQSQSIILELKQTLFLKDQILKSNQCQHKTVQSLMHRLQAQKVALEDKIKRIESLVSKQNQHFLVDYNERSMSIDSSLLLDGKHFSETVKALEDELEGKNISIFKLQKQKEILRRQIQRLKSSIQQLMQQKIPKDSQSEKKLRRNQNSNQSQRQFLYSDLQEERDRLKGYCQQIDEKYFNLNTQFNLLKEDNLRMNTDLIKTTAELTYTQEALNQMQEKLEKSKQTQQKFKKLLSNKEIDSRPQIEELQLKLVEAQGMIEMLRGEQSQIKFQGRHRSDIFDLKNQSNNLDVQIFNFSKLNEESQIKDSLLNKSYFKDPLISEKLKQVELALQMNQQYSEKMQQQYQKNIGTLNNELNQKRKQISSLQSLLNKQSHECQNANNIIQELQTWQDKNISQIAQLKKELRQSKDNQSRLNNVMQDLFKSLEEKESKVNEMIFLINEQSGIIQHFKDEQYQLSQNLICPPYLLQSQFSSQDCPEEDKKIFEMLSNIQKLKQKILTNKFTLAEMASLLKSALECIQSLKNSLNDKNMMINTLTQTPNRIDLGKSQRINILNDDDSEDDEEIQIFQDDNLQKLQIPANQKQKSTNQSLILKDNNVLTQRIQKLGIQLNKAQEQESELFKQNEAYQLKVKKMEYKIEQFQKSSAQRAEIINLFVAIIINIGVIDGVCPEKQKTERKSKNLEQLNRLSKLLETDSVSIRRFIERLLK